MPNLSFSTQDWLDTLFFVVSDEQVAGHQPLVVNSGSVYLENERGMQSSLVKRFDYRGSWAEALRVLKMIRLP